MQSATQDPKVSSEEPTWGRPVQAEIDLSAIASNVRTVKAVIGSRCKVMAVVKADGYGLGAPWVAGAALEGGASWLGVACVDEGIQLRRAGYSGRILVMGYVPPDEAAAAVANNLTLNLHRARTAYALEEAARKAGLGPGNVRVHIKVDTGLGRYGCLPEEFLPLVDEIARLPHLYIEGLNTHFANADATDLSFAREQLDRFNHLRANAEARGMQFEVVHAANSAAALALPEARFDMVRIGIMLSGYVPAEHLEREVTLTRAVSLRSRLARVYEANIGHTVGYGRTWTAKGRSTLGLIPVGYADGYRRLMSNRGEVLVHGVRCPVIGRVSMDQMGVDLSRVPDALEGDEVVLIGKQGSDEITADDLAEWSGTISYEVLCGLSARVPRRYMREGLPVEEYNLLGSKTGAKKKRTRKELSR